MIDLEKFFDKNWRPYYIVPIVLGVVVAFLDGYAFRMFQKVEDQSFYSTIVGDYMNFFHGFVGLVILGMVVMVYYYRDWRDALGLGVFSFVVVYTGFWDVLYYLFSFTPDLPGTFPHLSDSPAGWMAVLLNSGVVSLEMLVLNMLVFVFLGLGVAGFIRRS